MGTAVARCIRAVSAYLKGEVVERNVHLDHVHLSVMLPPKLSVSALVGTGNGRTAIRRVNNFRHLKYKP